MASLHKTTKRHGQRRGEDPVAAEAFQRANSYQIGYRKTTTGTVADNSQTAFANEASNEIGNKKGKEKDDT